MIPYYLNIFLIKIVKILVFLENVTNLWTDVINNYIYSRFFSIGLL